jgi:hypothetical protein
VTYICCGAKKKAVTYFILFLFLFFSSIFLTRFLGVSQQGEFKNTKNFFLDVMLDNPFAGPRY